MIVVLKFGTSSIIKNKKSNISQIVKDVVELKKAGIDVILVSSGAVGFGREFITCEEATNVIQKAKNKKILAGVGQSKLMFEYVEEFSKYNLFASQILLTKTELKKSKYSQPIIGLLKDLIKRGDIVPIINENDAITNKSNMFVDNDELAGCIAKKLDADRLVIITNTDGVYFDFGKPTQRLIKEIDIKKDKISIGKEKTLEGRGGMFQKIKIAESLAKKGIKTTILSTNEKDGLRRLLCENEKLGTLIFSSKK